VAGNWEDERDAVLLHNPAIPGTRNAIRTTLNRLWLAPLVQPDPDVVYFRSVDCRLRPDQKRLLQSLALLCGFRATSDLPQWLTATERDALRAFLLAAPNITQTNVRSFSIDGHDVDFSTALPLHNAPTGWTAVKSVLFSWLADHRLLLRFDHALGKRALARRLKRIRK
jgi:alpha-galactosidase